MATIKVFDCNGCKELRCFDTLASVPYMVDEPVEDEEPKENNPFE